MLAAAVALTVLACDRTPNPAPAPTTGSASTPTPTPTPSDAARAPTPTPTATPDAVASAPVDAGGATPDAMDPEDVASAVSLGEKLGPVRTGMTDAEVLAAAGEPKRKGRARSAGEATGDFEQDWVYPGGSVTLAADRRDGPVWTVRSIAVSRTDGWRTQRGIGIGANRADVERAYTDVLSADYTDEEHVVAGSIYGGIVFAIKRGKVGSIFVGAAAF